VVPRDLSARRAQVKGEWQIGEGFLSAMSRFRVDPNRDKDFASKGSEDERDTKTSVFHKVKW